MTLRTAPVLPATDPALDEAVDHIGALSERLWAVRRLHGPVRRRNLFGVPGVRCAGCGHALPCPTLRAVAPGRP